MFSLIITIISIALVAALALATIYYGGTAFNRGTAEAKASQLINEGQQINAAVALAKADIDRDGYTSTVTADVLTNGLVESNGTTRAPGAKPYLAQIPAGWSLSVAGSSTGPTQVVVGVTPVGGPTPAVTPVTAVAAKFAVHDLVGVSQAAREFVTKKSGSSTVVMDGVFTPVDNTRADNPRADNTRENFASIVNADPVYGVVGADAANSKMYYKL